jgi:hypothetical protein
VVEELQHEVFEPGVLVEIFNLRNERLTLIAIERADFKEMISALFQFAIDLIFELFRLVEKL